MIGKKSKKYPLRIGRRVHIAYDSNSKDYVVYSPGMSTHDYEEVARGHTLRLRTLQPILMVGGKVVVKSEKGFTLDVAYGPSWTKTIKIKEVL